ncbi:MAG: hypothetical protein ACREEN_00490 [Stellaceae bacterium]
MGRQFRLWSQGHPLVMLPPAADAAGRISSYYSLAGCHKAFILCLVDQGNATTVEFTPLQATDTSGSNSKALSSSAPIVADQDTAASDILALQTAAANFTTSATLKSKLVIFEIDPLEVMDVNEATPFSAIAIETGASNAANVTSALLLKMPLRDPSQIGESESAT